jgi:hypothetical protein
LSTHTPEYLENPLVSLNNGKHHKLEIIAFTITHQTIGAHVSLNNDIEMLSLWDNDLSETQFKDIISDTLSKKSKINGIRLERAARAHITIGLANGIQAVQTGYDLISILTLLKSDETLVEKNKADLEDSEFIYLDNARCYVKQIKPLVLISIFSLDFF